MKIVHHIEELRQTLAPFQRPAFVPTMGNLHAGHIALVEQARPLGDVTVASIFVNRLQFLPLEDFDSCPRTWDADCDQLKAAGPALTSQLPALEAAALKALAERGWQPDYLTVRRRSDLQLPQAGDTSLVALGAARVGTTRLIDNLEFTSISP